MKTKWLAMPAALMAKAVEPLALYDTVEPVLKDHPIGHKNVVGQDRWSLVTGSVVLKCRSFCHKYVVCQDRWSLMAVVSQDRFHCIYSIRYFSLTEKACVYITTNPFSLAKKKVFMIVLHEG